MAQSLKKKSKYALISHRYGTEIFSFSNDKEAEDYVEANYEEEDGLMTLYKLKHVNEWG